jgi:hypothetical protein
MLILDKRPRPNETKPSVACVALRHFCRGRECQLPSIEEQK